MKLNRSRGMVLLAAMLLVVVTSGGRATAGEQERVVWKIAGEFTEACTCAPACPCWFGSKPTRMKCGGGESLFIEKGHYGNVSLDGLAVANIGQSPAGKSMMESFGNWEFVQFYIDERATPEQRKGLEAIMRTIRGPASRNMQVRYVPVTHTVKDGVHTVRLGNHGTITGELHEGGLGGHTTISNPAGADPLRKEYHQGHTTSLKYNDAGQNWDLSDTNFMHHKFEITSEDYEKFAAGLAQKKQQMKK